MNNKKISEDFMNEVFLIIRVKEINYKFSIQKNTNAICNIVAILKNNSVINLIAYNEMADKCLKLIKQKRFYYIEGMINSNMNIVIKDIHKKY